MWTDYYCVNDITAALQLLDQFPERAKIIAGGTDLILELEKGVHKGKDTLVDISRIPGSDLIAMDDAGNIHIGTMATHNDMVSSKLIREFAYPLSQASWQVGSPQIRNRGTVIGNLVTASPANDTIPALMSLRAQLVIKSLKHERLVPLIEFYRGVRKTILQPNEMVIDIILPKLHSSEKGAYYKLALRNAQAISVVNGSIVLSLENGIITDARIALGAVAPTIILAPQAQNYLIGKKLTDETIEMAAGLASKEGAPIDDIRASSRYRQNMIRVVVKRCLLSILKGVDNLPERPPLLRSKKLSEKSRDKFDQNKIARSPIITKINGKEYVFTTGQQKSLLRLIREEAKLTGTKEGCSEGECGACTILLDGKAVMSCLVPAPRAHGAEIVTIEGIAPSGKLHPIQQSFIDNGAVQCGYCTPGFIMSSVALLDEITDPSRDEIMNALTGNLCRCTGYYKIIEAVEKAAVSISG